jgi:hypothetical protein
MQIAKVFGLEVPFSGIYGKDGELSFTFWSIAGEGKAYHKEFYSVEYTKFLNIVYSGKKKLIPVLVSRTYFTGES